MPYPIAYQLYSSRNFLPLEAQLPDLKAMGYDAIEPWLPAYEADDGRSFRRALDANGLKCFGFHMPLSGLVGETQRFLDIALTLGANAGLLWQVSERVGLFGQLGLRWVSGMSEVDGLEGTGLETINDKSSRWTMPFLMGIRARF